MYTNEQLLAHFVTMLLNLKAQAFWIGSSKPSHTNDWMVWRDQVKWPTDPTAPI